MKASIIRIGNSRGIRLPKPLIDQCGFKDEVEVEVRNHELVLRPVRTSREKWEEAFMSMAAQGDDRLLDTPASAWDEDEWEWK